MSVSTPAARRPPRLRSRLVLWTLRLLLPLFVAGTCLVVAEVGLRVRKRLAVRENLWWRISADIFRRSEDPELIYELRPGARSEGNGVVYRHNSDGFRDAEFPRDPPPDALRVAVVGDSIAWGFGVPVEQAIPDLIEAGLAARAPPGASPPIVYNLAVGGYSMAQELRLFETRVRELDPDLVLWFYCLNDPDENDVLQRHFGSPALELVRMWGIARRRASLYLEAKAEIEKAAAAPPDRARLVEAPPEDSDAARASDDGAAEKGEDPEAEDGPPDPARLAIENERIEEGGVRARAAAADEDYIEFIHRVYRDDIKENFRRLGELSRETGIPVLVAVVPILDGAQGNNFRARIHEWIGRLCLAHKLHYVDLFPGVAHVDGPEIALGDDWWHPNPEGHRLLADYLLRQLDARPELLRKRERKPADGGAP